MSTQVTVTEIPLCDLDASHGPAYADAMIPPAPPTVMSGGPWANLCRACFDRFGCTLGTGHGQRLVLDLTPNHPSHYPY